MSSNIHHKIPLSVARLAPFLDTEGTIRVGGRICQSNAMKDFKFPSLLPKLYVLIMLLMRIYHIKYLHAGPQLESSNLFIQFWILSNQSIVRSIIFKYVTCVRQRATW